MANIKLVIELDEGLVKSINENLFELYNGRLYNAIRKGVPLPKEHGRLIDADKLKLTQHDIYIEAINYRHRCISIENIDEAPTIIETSGGK